MKKQIIFILLTVVLLCMTTATVFSQQTDELELLKQDILVDHAILLRENRPDLFKGAKGVLILSVDKGSQGEKKGLQRGDIVISYAGRQVNSVEQFRKAVLANSSSETQVELGFIRDRNVQKTILQGGHIGIYPRDIKAEVSLDEFFKQLTEAGENKDNAKIEQLMQQNPKNAKRFLEGVRQRMDPNTTKMNLLNEEGQKAINEGKPLEAIAKFEKALGIAKEIGNKEYIAWFLGNLGSVFQNMEQYDNALNYFKEALAIHKEIGDKLGERDRLSKIAAVYVMVGQYENALNYFKQTLAIHKELGDKIGEGDSLTKIGSVYGMMGQHEKALGYIEQALAIQKEIGDKVGEADSLARIALYIKVGKDEKRLSYYEKALAIYKEIGDREKEGGILRSIGAEHGNLGRYETALNYYEKALAIYKEIGDRRKEGGILSIIGAEYGNLGQNETALNYYEKALAICKEIGSRGCEGLNLSIIGGVYETWGQYKKALKFYEDALKIRKEIGDRSGEGDNLSNIGGIYEDMGQYEKALKYYKDALAIHRDIKNRVGENRDLNNIANIYQQIGQYKKSLKSYEQLLLFCKETENREFEGGIFINISLVYIKLGQYEKALTTCKQALAIKKETGNREGEGASLATIGTVYDYLCQYDKAMTYYEQALAIYKEIGKKREEGTVLGNIGAVYDIMGYYDNALNYFNKALEIHKKIGDKKGEATILGNISLAYSNFGQYEKALSYCEQCLAICKEIGDKRGEGTNLGNIGKLYVHLGQYEKALSCCKQALAISKETGSRAGEGVPFLNMGAAYRYLGKYEKAVPSFRESIKICSEIGETDILWVAQRGLAEAEVKLNKYDDAVKHYEQSLDNLEAVREGISEKEHRTLFMQNKIGVYDEFITLLQQLHKEHPKEDYDKRAFEIFERKQGRVFLERMGESGARNFKDFPDEKRNQEIGLANRLANARSLLADERSKPSKNRNIKFIREQEATIEKITEEQIKLQEEIRTLHPGYYALRYPNPVELKELQSKVLRSGEFMLIYNIMEENTCLWVIGKDQFAFYPLGISEKIIKKIGEFRKETHKILTLVQRVADAKNPIAKDSKMKRLPEKAKKNLPSARQKGAELYDMLIPENARSLISKAEVLYIVPTGYLYALPFEVLGQETRYLLEDHAITYLSSASLLKILREAQARRKDKPVSPLLAFAHPRYGTGGKKCYSLTKGSDTAEISLAEIRLRGYLDLMGGNLCELEETKKEAEEIRKCLNAPKAALQIQEKASESNVFKFNQDNKLDDYRYVVFSCHGIFLPDEKNRLNQPALALSLPDPSDKNRDGFLTMGETFELKLNAELVVLSACNSGMGKLQRGEGVRGLTRAFMFAGTPAVSVTLWPVATTSSSLLTTGFFKNREQKKMPRAEALRNIKLGMIQGEYGELYQHPFFWAPMVIFGDAN